MSNICNIDSLTAKEVRELYLILCPNDVLSSDTVTKKAFKVFLSQRIGEAFAERQAKGKVQARCVIRQAVELARAHLKEIG
jgi:hypothetical protein